MDQTWYLLWKAIIFSWKSPLKVLTPSIVPLNTNRAFTLIFMADGVPLVSHLMKVSLSSRYLPLLQESPFDLIWGYLDRIVVEGNEIELAPLTPS